jgi:hypothetical protein
VKYAEWQNSRGCRMRQNFTVSTHVSVSLEVLFGAWSELHDII